ncbi:AAEL006768-PA [Aedes aegypti]|uniref:AAEL006768-PA n=1 Tax=Aedes aegypti TaxID=7159 RepID=Q174U9_AEDAE|nr:AAEL006768-PA [Aedes aegypti]
MTHARYITTSTTTSMTHKRITVDDEDRRYKNFMNAIKRKRLQHLKEQLQQQEIVSNQQ